jgi:polysaccharide export outer membrane protein
MRTLVSVGALLSLMVAVPPAGAQGAQPQAVRQARGSPAPVDSQDYRLGPGDKLRIEVYKDPQLSQSLQVRPDGKITLPFVGDVVAASLTPTELRDHLTAALREYVNNPVVTVIVVEALASAVYVMGEVNHPGTLTMTGPMTVVQALAMAGGFKDFANTKDIRIIRPGTRGVETLRFNYKDAISDGAAPVYLKPGDTVIVR